MSKSPKAKRNNSVTIHDQKPRRGQGGELHQNADGGTPLLTTAQGGPVVDDQNALRSGARGCKIHAGRPLSARRRENPGFRQIFHSRWQQSLV